jgi:PhzF family phenazine biosynthesis protein
MSSLPASRSGASSAALSVQRLAAFGDGPGGGNPAGVVIVRRLPPVQVMQRTAADVGYSETAFLCPLGPRAYRVRYFSPEREVPFCGHATIAAGVALAAQDGHGRFELHTQDGPISVEAALIDGRARATLTSPDPELRAVPRELLAGALGFLGWKPDELHRRYEPALAFAGAWHLVLVVTEHRRLRELHYDFAGLRELMLAHELTTLQLVWPETPRRFHVRDPFPAGGVVEDPATGAAAAALGAYLRERGRLSGAERLELLQGADMGRPSRLEVELVPGQAGVRVTGTVDPISACPR